jgi:hypothetical protein
VVRYVWGDIDPGRSQIFFGFFGRGKGDHESKWRHLAEGLDPHQMATGVTGCISPMTQESTWSETAFQEIRLLELLCQAARNATLLRLPNKNAKCKDGGIN